MPNLGQKGPKEWELLRIEREEYFKKVVEQFPGCFSAPTDFGMTTGPLCETCLKPISEHWRQRPCVSNPAPDVTPGEIPENGQRWEP